MKPKMKLFLCTGRMPTKMQMANDYRFMTQVLAARQSAAEKPARLPDPHSKQLYTLTTFPEDSQDED